MKALKAQGIPLITFRAAAGDGPSTVSMRRRSSATTSPARRNTVVEAIKTGKPIVGVEPGRESLAIFGMTPIMRDGKSAGQCRRRRRLRQGIRRSRQKALRRRPRGAFVRRQGLQEAVLDLRRRGGRHAGRAEERVRRRSRCAATPRSTAIPPRSISGRSRITPASRSALLELIKDTTEYEAAAASSQRNLILGTLAILAGASCWRSCSVAACRAHWPRSPR